MVLLLAVLAIVLFVLSGVNVGWPRFTPGWFGLAIVVILMTFTDWEKLAT